MRCGCRSGQPEGLGDDSPVAGCSPVRFSTCVVLARTVSMGPLESGCGVTGTGSKVLEDVVRSSASHRRGEKMMPLADTRRPKPREASSRSCRRCGSQIRLSTLAARGVVCTHCGSTSPSDGVVRGGNVIIPRPTELRAIPIGDAGSPPPGGSLGAGSRVPRAAVEPTARAASAPRDPRRRTGTPWAEVDRGKGAARPGDVLRAITRWGVRAERTFASVRQLRVQWSIRLVASLATVALAGGVAVVVVTLLS